jgi:hypothetical protein
VLSPSLACRLRVEARARDRQAAQMRVGQRPDISWIVVVRPKRADFADQGTPPPMVPERVGTARGRHDVSNEEPSHVGE